MLYTHIKKLLTEAHIPFTEISHEISQNCDHSKEMRTAAGLEWIGSKNIIFHGKGNFYLVTTLWDKDIKARNFKSEFWTKDIRFASQEEITLQIGATIWSIPPFGFQNTTIPLYIDKEIFEHDFFLFNPWRWDISIQISTKDLKKIYASLSNPTKIFEFRDEKKEFELLE